MFVFVYLMELFAAQCTFPTRILKWNREKRVYEMPAFQSFCIDVLSTDNHFDETSAHSMCSSSFACLLACLYVYLSQISFFLSDLYYPANIYCVSHVIYVCTRLFMTCYEWLVHQPEWYLRISFKVFRIGFDFGKTFGHTPSTRRPYIE